MKKVSNKKFINAIVEEDPRGGFSAFIPAMPGLITEGRTMKELQQNLEEAISAWTKASKNPKVDYLQTYLFPVEVHA